MIDKYLKQRGLMSSTRGVYNRVYANMNLDDPVTWLKNEIAQRQPLGTLLPKRAMAKHVLVSLHGLDEDVADQMLPKLKGRQSRQRQGLSKDQYTKFFQVINAVPNPSRTILKLLPLTGLRIAEICKLEPQNIEFLGDRAAFRFRGKGDKERLVPLSESAFRILNTYLIDNGYMHEDGTGMMTGGYIFENNKGSHITPAAVRKHCRKLANDNPMLSGLSPHILRHTFATRANRAGVDLKALQALLGHSQITTTSRYLHPTADDLVAAIDKLGDNT